ncbi:MAG: DNA alkylation repair protein [Dehalococcoidia bacterium]|nr:DNA alkylation repair protein [Dehalococcoidia bacterium]
MPSVEEVMERLKSNSRSDRLEGMDRYGMAAERRLGVSIPDVRKIAKELGKNHDLTLELWKTGIAEAMILAALTDNPDELTEEQMEDWVKDINSWDVCDQVCMNLFEKTPLAWRKIIDWSEREEEFVKRTAFALIACLAWHDKKLENEKFIELFPVIVQGATDERNFVKKAVNWALRNIGKKNLALNKAAINTAREIQQLDSKAARWIASDTLRELESEAVQTRLTGVSIATIFDPPLTTYFDPPG